MAADDRICPACGARGPADASVCDLCGYALDTPDADAATAETPDAPRAMPATSATGGAYCNTCGWKNPPGARFCSQCGTALQTVSAGGAAPDALAPRPLTAPPAAAPEVPPGVGRRLGVVIGAAVLLVVGLYFVTVASRDAAPAAAAPAETGAPATGGAAPGGPAAAALAPLSPEVEAQVADLQAEADAATGAAKQSKQRELVNLLIGVGRPDRAADVQEALAIATDAPTDWKRAGDLLYGWMELLDEAARPPVAARVVAAYDRVLAADANDLDARTNLGWAAQYAGGNPMRAVEETQAVLRQDSNHVGANYNRAWLLMRIGRTEQAIAQLEKVVALAGPTTPLGREATQMIGRLRSAPAGAAPPAAGPPSSAPAP